MRQQLITVEVIEEFFFRQHRYLLELLPAPIGVRRAKMWLAEVLTIGVLAVCGRWLYARRQACGHAVERLGFYGAVWYGITIAPMVVTYFSPRHLYITTAGVSIALASLILPGDPVENRRRTRIRLAMAGMIVVLYAGASIWNVSNWVASGVESQRFVAAASRLLQSAPRDSVVLVSAPESLLNGWFWSWATPFALQPPFPDRGPVREVQDRRAPHDLLLPAGSVVGGQEGHLVGADGFAGAAAGDVRRV